MRLTGKNILSDFASSYPDAKDAIESITLEFKKATWMNSNELKAQYCSASLLGSGCVVFNICGNKYRIVAKVIYKNSIIIVRWAGRHKEYDKLDIRGTKCLSSD